MVFMGIGGIFAVMFFMFIIVILFAIFWIWMIVDCAQRKFKDDGSKIAWILIVVLLGFIGAIIYYFVIKIKDKK